MSALAQKHMHTIYYKHCAFYWTYAILYRTPSYAGLSPPVTLIPSLIWLGVTFFLSQLPIIFLEVTYTTYPTPH